MLSRNSKRDKFVVMGSRKGVIKKTSLSAFSNPQRAGGIIAMGVEDGDAVITVQLDRRQRRDFHRHA